MKSSLKTFITSGAGFVNICRAYMKNELYDKCLELSLIATKGFASVPPDELSDSNIQVCNLSYIFKFFNFRY